MDTCLILTELDPAVCDAGLKKVKGYLQGYSFSEYRDASEADMLAYQRGTSIAEGNWREFVKYGFSDFLAALPYYAWRRMAGEIEIENRYHDVELYLYPVSASKAAVSVVFGSRIYEAIYSFRPTYEHEVDLNVKQDFVALLLLIASSFSPSGFALKMFAGVEDFTLHLKVEDVRDWLVAPTPESIRRWRFLFVGIRATLVQRQQVEEKWAPERLYETSYGYFVNDRIAF